MNEPSSNGTKRLYRPRDGRVVAGVCAGLAAYFGVDPTLVRLAFALVTVFGGLGVLIYLCAWVVIPEEGGDGLHRRDLRQPATLLGAYGPPPRPAGPGSVGRRCVQLTASMVAAVTAHQAGQADGERGPYRLRHRAVGEDAEPSDGVQA